MSPVGDDGQQDVITLLHPARARFDHLDPLREAPLIVLERRARLGRDALALSGADARQRQHHQVGDVDERGETGHRLVGRRVGAPFRRRTGRRPAPPLRNAMRNFAVVIDQEPVIAASSNADEQTRRRSRIRHRRAGG